jgi:simple sugar transport system permease protein
VSAGYTERGQGSATAEFLAEHAQVLSIAAFFVICLVFFSAMTDVFATTGNILNVLRQAAPILIVAVAMTFVIITAGIDLSVGSQVALINASAALALQAGLPWPVVVLAMLALGAMVGLAQGWFVAFQGIPAFIVTLAGLSILRGIALYMTQGYSIPIRDVPGFFYLGRGTVFDIPMPALIALAIAVLGGVVMSRTLYGRRVGEPEAEDHRQDVEDRVDHAVAEVIERNRDLAVALDHRVGLHAQRAGRRRGRDFDRRAAWVGVIQCRRGV